MVAVPLGMDAYKRAAAGAAEIRLVNRFLEKAPQNLREHLMLLTRAGTKSLTQASAGPLRALYSRPGLFNSDLFICSANNLYRFNQTSGLTAISGTLGGSGFVYTTWMKGIGYEFLFVSDGVTLQYYTTHAMGTLTMALNAPDGNITNQVLNIGGIYYGWATNVNPVTPPAGTAGNPYLALVGTANLPEGQTADELSLANMAALINFSGIGGYQYSETVASASPWATATNTNTTLVLTATNDGVPGNTVNTSVVSGSFLTFANATLTGGGNQALQSVPMPNGGESPKALAALADFVLVSVGGTRKFYYIQPGAVTIDGLDFASKESQPDTILDMTEVGDAVLIHGDGSTESWYATGQLNTPFAPQQGRTYHRGIIDGTSVKCKNSIIFIGEDMVVYEIGSNYGDEVGWNANPISTPGIEERIRTQIRSLQGLSP